MQFKRNIGMFEIQVCAPRMHSKKMDEIVEEGTNRLIEKEMDMNHGICYLTSNTKKQQPSIDGGDVKSINKAKQKDKQHIGFDVDTLLYRMAEQGLSVHVADDGSTVLIGAPGIYQWKGSVVLFSRIRPSGGGGAAVRRRRQTTAGSFSHHKTIIPDPQLWNQMNDSYFGYAVSSGYFRTNHQKLMYVASAPQANNQKGEVYVFDIVSAASSSYNISIWETLRGDQIGEYFGYALVTEDFNGDGYSDLAVAAPFHSWDNDAGYDQGAVYVFENYQGERLELRSKLRSEFTGRGRFGTTISRIGDLNGDGFNGK